MTANAPRRHLPQSDAERFSLAAEQARLLYSNLSTSIVINTLVALILVAVQSAVIPQERLMGWLALLGMVLLGRGMLLMAWTRARGVNPHIRRWLNRFRVGAIATGVAWGIGGTLLYPPTDLAHQAYVSFVLAGLAAGSFTTLAVDRVSSIGFLAPSLLPNIVYFAAEGGVIPIGMSAMITLFLIFVAASARRSHIQLQENFLWRIKAIDNEARLRQMLESSPVATRISDAASDRVVFANISYAHLIGATTEQTLGAVPSRYYADPEAYAGVLERLRRGEPVTNQLVELRAPEGRGWTKWVLASYFQIDYEGRPAILGWFYDITDQKIKEEEITRLAYRDTLTGLPNRLLFGDRLQQAIATAERDRTSLALMFIDLDRFKPINDRYGHDVGDLLLKEVAIRIQDCLRKSDTVARIGGDEFVVLLPFIKTRQNASALAEQIRHALHQPFEIAAHRLGISCSIGIAIYPDHAAQRRELIKCADTAMYQAKAQGRNGVILYRTGMEDMRA